MNGLYSCSPSSQFFTNFYDPIRKICCQDWMCIPPTLNTLPPPLEKSIFELAKAFCFKPWITAFLFIAAVGATLFAWNKIALKVELDGQTRHLRTWRTFLMYLNYPKAIPTAVIVLWFSFLYLLFDQAISIAWPSPLNVSFSDYFALSIAATAILFPLIILIMDGNKEDHPGVFPSSEVLLRHALAFPISVVLLSILALSAFRMNYYWMRITVVISVILAALALLRLLHVIFVPKAWRKTEDTLLKTQTQDTIAEIAHQRAGFIKTRNALKTLDPFVTDYIGTFGKEEYLEYKVKAGQVGRIEKVDMRALSAVARKLSQKENLVGASTNNAPATSENKSKIKQDFQIIVRANVGEIIEKPNEVLAALRCRRNTLKDSEIKSSIEGILKAFVIDPLAETDLSTEQLDVLLSRLRMLGMEAVDRNNEILADRISATYRSLVEAVLEAFDGLGIKYSLGGAKQENSFFGNDWKPLTRMFENIGDWTEYLSKSDVPSRSLRSTIIYTPYRLALTAYDKRDLFTFVNSIRVALQQQYFDKANGVVSVSWLTSLADHHIGRELEEFAVDEKERKIILDYLRALFEVELNLAKNTIDAANEAAFNEALDLFYIHPKLFQFEHFDSDIQVKESYLRIADESSKKSIEAELITLRLKQDLRQKVKTWRYELLVGLAAYCLMRMDGKGRSDKNPPEEFLKKTFQSLLARLPSSFAGIVRLRIKMNRFDSSERWGWEWWETIPDGEVRAMSFHLYIDQVFSYLLLKSGIDGCNPDELTSLNLFERDVFDFRDDPQALGGKLKETNEKMEALNLTKLTEEQLNRLKECFSQIRTTAKLNSDLRLVNQELSPKIIASFKEEFQSSFLERSRFRGIFRLDKKKTAPEDGDVKWGINILVQREFWVEDSESGMPDLGNHYGSDLGQSEEVWVFKKIAEKTDTKVAKTVAELIELAVAAGGNLQSLIILSARDVYSMRALRSDPAFRYNHQVSEARFKGKCDGFILWNGELVPVISVFARGTDFEGLPNLIVLDASQITLVAKADESDPGYLEKTGFVFNLVDPLGESDDSKKLKADILKRNPDWLSTVPTEHKDKLIGKYVWLRVLENLDVTVRVRPVGMQSTVEE